MRRLISLRGVRGSLRVYALTLGLSLIAVTVTGLLRESLGGTYFFFPLAAITFLALSCGRTPALAMSVMVVIADFYFFTEPLWSFRMPSKPDLARLVSFFVSAVLISLLAGAWRESADRFRRAILNAPFPIIVHDEDGKVIQVSDGLTHSSGYVLADVPTIADWTQKAYGARQEVVRASIDALFSLNHAVPEGERTIRTKDGSARTWEFGAGPLGRVGRKRLVITMALDITERKQAEEALREADRHKNEFLGMLSHELRNPLAPIRNSLYLLNRAPGLDERGRKAIAVIDRQANQLARLVEDLLDVTRIARGKVHLHRTSVDFGDLVRHATDDHRSMFVAGDIQLDVQVVSCPIWVDGDPARLAQITGNLLNNAAKFTPKGGRVTVIARQDGEGHAELVVSDNGIGIDAETLPRLFEAFAQADRSLDRSRGGLGLGLALVKGLAELHGGEVRAFSDGPGHGARFSVKIPLGEPAMAKISVPAMSTEQLNHAPSRRIVVVEDNRDTAESLRDVLEHSGHHVVMATTGKEGLRMVRETRPDVVLCDIGLPEMDGYEVAGAIRGDCLVSRTFLVALTGYAQPEDRRRALEAGFDRHFAKPVDVDGLMRLLAEAPIAADRLPRTRSAVH